MNEYLGRIKNFIFSKPYTFKRTQVTLHYKNSNEKDEVFNRLLGPGDTFNISRDGVGVITFDIYYTTDIFRI